MLLCSLSEVICFFLGERGTPGGGGTGTWGTQQEHRVGGWGAQGRGTRGRHGAPVGMVHPVGAVDVGARGYGDGGGVRCGGADAGYPQAPSPPCPPSAPSPSRPPWPSPSTFSSKCRGSSPCWRSMPGGRRYGAWGRGGARGAPAWEGGHRVGTEWEGARVGMGWATGWAGGAHGSEDAQDGWWGARGYEGVQGLAWGDVRVPRVDMGWPWGTSVPEVPWVDTRWGGGAQGGYGVGTGSPNPLGCPERARGAHTPKGLWDCRGVPTHGCRGGQRTTPPRPAAGVPCRDPCRPVAARRPAASTSAAAAGWARGVWRDRVPACCAHCCTATTPRCCCTAWCDPSW